MNFHVGSFYIDAWPNSNSMVEHLMKVVLKHVKYDIGEILNGKISKIEPTKL